MVLRVGVRNGGSAAAVDERIFTQALFQVMSAVPAHTAEVERAVQSGQLVIVAEFGTGHFGNGVTELTGGVVDEGDVGLQRVSGDAFREFQFGCVERDVGSGLIELGIVNQVLGAGVHQFNVFIVQRHAVLSYRGN